MDRSLAALTEAARADVVGLFAGALVYTRYGWLKRRIMRRIAEADGRDVDTSRDHEYTDWQAVREFTTDFLTLLSTSTPNRAAS